MTDVERVLARTLPRLAARVPVPPGDPAAALARAARRRRQRRRRRTTSLTLVALLVGAVVVVQLRPDGHRPVSVSTTTAGLRRGETGIVWRHGDTPNALGYVSAQALGSTLYALSTAPGPADPSSTSGPPHVLYRSSDGVEWLPVDSGPDPYLASLSVQGDRLYAVGTGTASAVTTAGRPVAEVSVSWSDDAARTWRRTALALDVAAIASKSTTVQTGSLAIAAGAHGVVAVVGITAQLDLAKVLPGGVAAPRGWAVTDDGIDILGGGSGCPSGTTGNARAVAAPTTTRPVAGEAGDPGQLRDTVCYKPDGSPVVVTPEQGHGVERTFTWAELGIGGDLLQAVQATPMVFWSADGTSFKRVDAPLEHLNSVQATTDADGFVLVAQTAAPGATAAAVLRSKDGQHWSQPVASPAAFRPTAVGQLGGRVAMIGVGDRDPAFAILDGSAWRISSLTGVLDERPDPGSAVIAGAAVGPQGLVAVLQLHGDPVASAGGVSVKAGAYTLQVLDQRLAARVVDANGREVARTANLWSSQPNSGLLYDPTTQTVTLVGPGGAELARFSAQQINAALRTASSSTSSTSYSYEVLFSRDGTTWSAQPLGSLVAGQIARVGDVVVTDSKVIVTVIPPGGGAPADHATVLVGTT